MPAMVNHIAAFKRAAQVEGAMTSVLSQRGYTYFGILFVVALIGLALTGAALITQVERQRESEQQLLFIGQQYVNAIASYYHDAPGGNKHYPRTMAELLRDPRYPTIRRHLRKPWIDPLTHSREWGIVRTKQGGIAGIYSLAKGKPFKQAGFGAAVMEKLLANKNRYQDWKFIYIASVDDTVRPQKANVGGEDNADQAGSGEVLPLQNQFGTEEEVAAPEEESETGAELLPPEPDIDVPDTVLPIE